MMGGDRIFVNKSDDRNVIIAWKSITALLVENTVCCKCKKKNTMEFCAETIGIATKVSLACKNVICEKYNEWSVKEPAMVDLDKLVDDKCDPYDIKKCGNRATRQYQLNLDLTLGIMMIGGGGHDYALVASQLNLCCSQRQLLDSFTSNEETMALHIIKMAEEVVERNLNDEKKESQLVNDPITDEVHLVADTIRKRKAVENTPMSNTPALEVDAVSLDENQEARPRPKKKRNIGVSMDAGWRKRSSGRTYDAQQAQFFAFGVETNKILYFEQMSTRCRKCEHKLEHDPKLCSHNYTGSAKGMEPHAALKCIQSIFSKGDAFVGTIVTDDDSSMRARLKQNGREKIEAGLCRKEDLTPTIQLSNKNDHGALELNIPEPICKADANHRVRGFGNAVQKLVNMRNGESGGVTGVDRDRLKVNFAYARAKNVDKDFNLFCAAFAPVIEHHFNNHELCGEWCAAKKLTDTKKTADHLHYRCKVKNKLMYDNLKEIHKRYTTEQQLREIHHKVNTNLSESANFVVTKFLPKHKNFGTTIADKGRVHFSVCIITDGYESTMVELYKRMGFENNLLRVKGWTDIEKKRTYKKHYIQLDTIKRKRMMRKNIKKRENRKKEEKSQDKGEFYKPGMGLNEGTSRAALNTRKKAKKKVTTAAIDGKKKRTSCKLCKRKDHVNKSKHCPYHKNYVTKEGEDPALIKAMILEYPNGIPDHTVVEELKHDEVNLVDEPVESVIDENTGKWLCAKCEMGGMGGIM